MQRTFSKLLASQCRSRMFHVSTDLFFIEKTLPIDSEFGHRPLHCLLNTNLLSRHSSEISEIDNISETSVSAKDMSKWWVDYKKRKSYMDRCVSRISATLQCNESISNFLIDSDPLTFLDKIDSSLKTIEYLIEQGIPGESIRKNIMILRYPDSELELRIKCMKMWGIDKQCFGDFLPIFKSKTSDFLVISNAFIEEKDKNIPDGNRMLHLAKILGCSVMHLNKAFMRCKSLYRADFDHVKASLKCYMEFGVRPECILKDISGLKADVKTIQLRLAEPFSKGLHPLRPNLVTCTHFMYRKKCKELENRINHFAPYKNSEEYVTAKLFSNKHHISAHKKKKILTYFNTVNPENLINILEFLLEKEYTPDQICANLQSFGFDISTIRERHEMLQRAGIKSPSIRILTVKQDEFQEFMKRTEFNIKERKQLIAEMVPLVTNSKR